MKANSFVFLSRIFPILLLLLLLLYPACSVQGAAGGLLLWFHVVLPTLAPFMICTQMVVALGGVSLLVRPFYPLVHALFGLSSSGTYVLLCGLLCGYPLGARLCRDFLNQKKITHKEADYLLSICNHPSPMFLLGFVRGQISIAVFPAFLLTCMYLPILPVSFFSRRFYKMQETEAYEPSLSVCEANQPISLEEILLATAETMVLIGGYIMLFSILAAWIGQMDFLPPAVIACLSGIAEITTGVHNICGVLPPAAALPAVIATVAFGGFSGIFQTKSVIKNAGLSIRHYVFWKLLHTVFACLVLILLMTCLP